jgi:predicted nucleotidyltransferase
MSYGMHLEVAYIDDLVSRITSSAPVDEVYIFGSYARQQEHAGSDLDIYVVTSNNQKSRLDQAVDIRMGLYDMYSEDGLSKDVLCSPSSVFKELSRNPQSLEYIIAREGVKIYERV